MFDFLFSNPIIIIILIGVISSMLKKRNKPDQKKVGVPQKPKPAWKEVIQDLQKEWMEEEKKRQKPIREAEPVIVADLTEEERKRIAELKRLQQEYEGVGQSITKEVSPVFGNTDALQTISDEQSPIYSKGLSFGKQEVLNGIIMAEVLGRPRAKRSLHQTRR